MSDSTAEPCPICAEPTRPIAVAVASYRARGSHRVRCCGYCDLHYVEDRQIPDGLYEQIYARAAELPGYDRYASYQASVRDQSDPLGWLAAQEAAYWFVARELASLPRDAAILEIGSGLGYLTYAIHASGRRVTGIDVSEQAVARAGALFGPLYARRDLFALIEEPARYDACILTEVIEHVDDPVAFLNAAAALLKPGGKLLMTTPNKSAAPREAVWRTENPPVHLWWFSETAVRQLARRCGLEIAFCDYAAMYTGRPVARRDARDAGGPAWLDAAGDLTADARAWMRRHGSRQRRTGWLRAFAGPVARAIAAWRVRRRAGALALQRGTQIGAVLRNRD